MNRIAVDAMGGDDAPAPEVGGAVAAVREADVEVVLVGDRDRLEAELDRLGAAGIDRIAIEHADQMVTMDDHPARAHRAKPRSSMRLAFEQVAAGSAAAVVSAGNSGALLGHGLFVLGRIEGVERPAIVSVLPRRDRGTLVLCDSGANVEVKPTQLAQFGLLGVHYDRIAHRHGRPRLGLLSNGAEPGKGTELTRAASAMLAEMAADPEAGFDYVGYVEGSDLFAGDIDVVATDGFTGNVALKLAEGLAEAMFAIAQRSLPPGVPAALLDDLRKVVDYRERGGALLGGVQGVVMICHGRSDSSAIKNAIKAADAEVSGGMIENLAAAVARYQPLWDGVRTGKGS